MTEKTKTILIVDDDPAILHILKFNLLKGDMKSMKLWMELTLLK